MGAEEIAVLGGGHGAHAMAADLSFMRYKVNMFELPIFREKIQKLLETKEIEVIGRHGTDALRKAKINKVTTDIKKAIKGVKYIFIVAPHFSHKTFAELLAPYLVDQMIVLYPGTFGTLEFAKILKEKGVAVENLTLAETDTLPYGCRLLERGVPRVRIYYFEERLGVGVFPAKRTERVLEFLREIFPVFPYRDVLETGLSNDNPLIHVASTLLNAGRIEYSRGEFYLYEEGITPSVLKVIEAVDKERISIGEALGLDIPPKAQTYALEGLLAYGLSPIKGPTDLTSRYLAEDTSGLVAWSSLGDMINILTPVMKSLICIASVMHQKDYWKEGRNAEKLGISGLSKEDLLKYVKEGKSSA